MNDEWGGETRSGSVDSKRQIAIGKAASFLRFQAAYSVDATESARQEWRSTAEALTDIERRCQPQPAEDPDEWVVQDRVPRRENVDEFRWCFKRGYTTDWIPANFNGVQYSHGYIDSCGDKFEVRCRRRDLPKVEHDGFADRIQKALTPEWIRQAAEKENGCPVAAGGLIRQEPQPQKTRVRLWMTHNPNGSFIVASEAEKTGDWQELHYDAETKQFYVEQGQ